MRAGFGSFVYYISFLYPQWPCLDQLSRHSASTALWVWYIVFFLKKRRLSVHWQVLVSVKGILWGECFGLKICQFDTCLFHLTVCTCVHCQSLCVLRVYVCVYMSVNCIVYFSSMIWPLIVLRKRKHSGSLSIFLPYFFLFNVTMSLPNRLTHFEFSFHRK